MNISEECFKEIIEMVEALIEEADHHANKKNPVVKITDKNYQVASGKSLPGPFNKNHVGQYIVYNKDTDASYLVTPDNWKKSKIKKDLESQGKFYEALEILENIYDEINKKFMSGKISADKAIKLEKKFQDKMSPEKVKNDGKEIEAQYKDSLEPSIQYVKNLKALRRNDKKKNNGKSNLRYTFDYRPEALEEAFEETMKLLELFDRPDLLDDIDTLLGSPVKKTFKRILAPKKEKKVKTKVACKENLEEAMKLMEELLNEWDKTGYSNKVDKHLDNQLDNVPNKEGTKFPDENSLEYQNYMRDKVAADKASSEVWNQTRKKAEQNKANYNPNSKLMRAEAIMRAQLRKEGNK